MKTFIPDKERLIFALDVPDVEQAMALVTELDDSIVFYKVGLELFMTGGCFEFVEWLKDNGKRVFVDLKFFDVPQTVGSAVRQLAKYGVDFATVHGNDEILKAAVKEKGNMKILSVTALTSLDQGDINDLGFAADIKDIVLSRAKRSLDIGCDGVISSGVEVPALGKEVDDCLIVVTPGIRPIKNIDDQKRTVDVEQAFVNGVDYIVVGRPIKQHIGFDSPKEAAEDFQLQIERVFE